MLKFALNTFSNFLSPPFCASCRLFLQERRVLCSCCDQLLKPLVSQALEITSTKKMKILAASDYHGPLRQLILAKRFRSYISSRHLAQLIWEKTFLSQLEYDYLVPVPLHWSRYVWRGFNQSEIMADFLSKKTGKPVLNLLQRCRRTKYQSELKFKDRYYNVKDAFDLKNKFVLEEKGAIYREKRFVIVDDLMTTGATLKSMAKALLPLKPSSLVAVVAARVV